MTERLSPRGRLDHAAVTALHANLLACEGRDVIVDMGQVTHLGALSVQAMIAAANSARGADVSFRTVNTTAPVLRELAAMGIAAECIGGGRDDA